ncbi:helix-turn-helix domain-containing protein [Litoreibacter roseus]|uniref:XRE family transcriptional regulator n=1 Tax=Litoreibacter roseus TaxID=2601869 RepID=A0A6N6JJH4_9RHOB|nr:helix-turn-helix domain-containing protein [Litoreibacter roseus]GFE66284.1 XRE family transcriptional regulator [Litoreibacter roseus]
MLHESLTSKRTLGADIRALRKARGFTLVALAAALGRSVGWLSQVERDKSEPSISDLRQIATVLDISISSLFGSDVTPAAEQGYVVRKSARRPIGSRQAGLREELLSPDLTDDFELVHSTFEPGAVLDEDVSRPTQEVGYIISGKLDVVIGGTLFNLNEGDSFRIRGEPFRWANPYETVAVVIWAIAPPIY